MAFPGDVTCFPTLLRTTVIRSVRRRVTRPDATPVEDQTHIGNRFKTSCGLSRVGDPDIRLTWNGAAPTCPTCLRKHRRHLGNLDFVFNALSTLPDPPAIMAW